MTMEQIYGYEELFSIKCSLIYSIHIFRSEKYLLDNIEKFEFHSCQNYSTKLMKKRQRSYLVECQQRFPINQILGISILRSIFSILIIERFRDFWYFSLEYYQQILYDSILKIQDLRNFTQQKELEKRLKSKQKIQSKIMFNLCLLNESLFLQGNLIDQFMNQKTNKSIQADHSKKSTKKLKIIIIFTQYIIKMLSIIQIPYQLIISFQQKEKLIERF
ncbi:unnamed protein product [Paramecium sonneborni]|uniref:Transmembrane protein n=1 Tax=Paramecium sonneborni TaxID=65129 RepID=A0A8S1QZF5_9CILI|nr:unnamed protein product [Paramecium sonneborni]